MFTNNFDPVAIQIFSLEIRWYSLAYIVGILVGWVLIKKFFISEGKIYRRFDDFITYIIIAIILGGRLGYVFFYNIEYYKMIIKKLYFMVLLFFKKEMNTICLKILRMRYQYI